jgi:hypothetical protein
VAAKKCNKKSWCSSMAKIAEPGAMKGMPAGVRIAQFFSLSTGKPTRTLIVLKKSKTDRGVVLNFCPWCGAKIIDLDLDTEAKEKKS